MSELNVDIYSSGYIGVGTDNSIKSSEQTNVAPKQDLHGYSDKKTEITSQEVNDTVEDINHFLQDMKRNLSFSVDESSGNSIIMVKDSESDEVIRQIPSEELLVLRKKMDDVVGILFDEKV